MHLRSAPLTDAPLEPLIKNSAHSPSHLFLYLRVFACLAPPPLVTNLSVRRPHLVNIYVVEVSSISLCVRTLLFLLYIYITSLSHVCVNKRVKRFDRLERWQKPSTSINSPYSSRFIQPPLQLPHLPVQTAIVRCLGGRRNRKERPTQYIDY